MFYRYYFPLSRYALYYTIIYYTLTYTIHILYRAYYYNVQLALLHEVYTKDL